MIKDLGTSHSFGDVTFPKGSKGEGGRERKKGREKGRRERRERERKEVMYVGARPC